MLIIHERVVSGVTILDMNGQLTLEREPSEKQVSGLVRKLLAEGHTRFVLNMAGVTRLDTSGLTELVEVHLAASRRGGAVTLAQASPQLQRTFRVTRLSTLLSIFDSEQDAITAAARLSTPQ